MNFEYTQNPDGSFILYNTDIGDIYFSNIGAYNEAVEKFVLPASPKEQNKKKIKILDVCYGMGYNSKSFVDYCIKNNLDYEFEIDCIELDKNILSLALLIFDDNIAQNIHFKFGYDLISQVDLTENINLISGENWINHFWDKLLFKLDRKFADDALVLYKNGDFYDFLHNIYYQNHDDCNILDEKIKIKFMVGNLLDILPTLNNEYDIIFHDAFSIKKQPELWDEAIMQRYYDILNSGGKFLTYSKSVVLFRILNNIGFNVDFVYNNKNQKNSTLAIKK